MPVVFLLVVVPAVILWTAALLWDVCSS